MIHLVHVSAPPVGIRLRDLPGGTYRLASGAIAPLFVTRHRAGVNYAFFADGSVNPAYICGADELYVPCEVHIRIEG